MADVEAGKFYAGSDGLWTRGLLVRRSTTDNKVAFFTAWCPAGTGIETLVMVGIDPRVPATAADGA